MGRDGAHPRSLLQPVESMLERFLRERRFARHGEQAVHRREDEVRMEDAG